MHNVGDRFRIPLIVVLLAIVGSAACTGRAAPEEEQQPVAPMATATGTAWPSWGFTHTQYSVDQGPGSATAARELARQPMPQNVSIMGWGTDNPEPSPGAYNFGSLDSRIKFVRRSHGVPVITLCCAPDWMKGGRAGRTDWSKLEVAPRPEHYADFARLAATIARRYPDVRQFLVWNEFKGMFDETKHRWNYEAYTALYNKVYDALKKVNLRIQVGGPYMVMNSYAGRVSSRAVRGAWGSLDQRNLDAVRYWLDHKHGADFVAVDGASVSDDRGVVPNEFAALDKLSAVTRWLRERTRLPIWWSEWYVEPTGSGWTEPHRLAVLAAAMIQLADAKVTTALYWSPQTQSGDCPGCLWTGSGHATDVLDLLRGMARWFPSGTRLTSATVSPPSVRVLAQARQALLVNTSATPVTASLDGHQVALGGYGVRWVGR